MIGLRCDATAWLHNDGGLARRLGALPSALACLNLWYPNAIAKDCWRLLPLLSRKGESSPSTSFSFDVSDDRRGEDLFSSMLDRFPTNPWLTTVKPDVAAESDSAMALAPLL